RRAARRADRAAARRGRDRVARVRRARRRRIARAGRAGRPGGPLEGVPAGRQLITTHLDNSKEHMQHNLKTILGATFLLAATFLGVPAASADKLSDFKDASGKTGCESIPYSDLRSSCKSQQSNVHVYCDGAKGPVTCGSESVTRKLKEDLEKEKKGVDAL